MSSYLLFGRNQVDDHQRVGRHLLDVDPLVLHQRRNDRQRQRHAILHQHLGHVGIHAQLERDRQLVGAVVGRLRRHIHHALDAADLLLDRRGHGVADRLRIGPGIQRRHLHRRRRDVRILSHRQREHRHAAGEHEHDRDHRGENRPVDEKFCNHRQLLVAYVRYRRCSSNSVSAINTPADVRKQSASTLRPTPIAEQQAAPAQMPSRPRRPASSRSSAWRRRQTSAFRPVLESRRRTRA